MTRATISLIIAVLFVVVGLSTPIFLCRVEEKVETDRLWYEEWEFCKLDGEQLYFGTEKISDPFVAGVITGVFVFLICLVVISILFPTKKVIKM